MAKKEVTVVINGEEYVSKAAMDAGNAMDGFKNKSAGWINGLADLKAGWDFLKGSIQKAWGVVTDSIAAYDELRGAQRKLEGTAKLTGVALEELQIIATVGRTAFKLSTTVASDFAAEIAKLTQKAGQTDKAAESLAAFLNIGAARGLGAADTLKAVQQAILGIDEGTDKLFNKNPSVIYEEFAGQIGKTAGKLTDQEKAQALLNEALEGGIRTYGEYAKYLDSSAGKAAQFEQANREAAAQLGESMETLRKQFLDMGTEVVPWYYDTWRRNVDDLTGTLKTLESAGYAAFAALAKLIGNKDSAEEWGRKAAEAAKAAAVANDRANKSARELAESQQMVGDGLGKVLPQYKATTEAQNGLLSPLGSATTLFGKQADAVASVGPRANMSAKEVAAYGDVTVRAAGDSEKALKKAEAAALAAHRQMLTNMARLYEGTVTVTQAMERLRPAVEKGLAPERVKTFNDVMDKSRQLGDELIAKMRQIKIEPAQLSTVEELQRGLKDNADELVGIARGGLDVAQAFGGISRESASALTSVLNIGQAIGQMATGNPIAGISGILGGVASIVNTMMNGDAARRALLSQNNDALRKLSKGIDGLNLNVTGDDIERARTALGGATFSTAFDDFAGELFRLRDLLGAQGISLSEFERIAKELGINLKDKNGNFSFGAVNQAIQALGLVRPGRVGQGFQDQLEFFRNSQRVNGNEGLGAIQGLIDFLRTTGNVRALDGINVMSDPTGAVNQLRAIFTQLGNGEGISAEGLGRLTGGQFSDLLMEIIGGLTSGSSGSTGGGVIDIPTGGGSGGGVSVPVDTVQSVIKAMDTNLGTILTAHTTLHERIAVATEGSYGELQQINMKMDTLIAVSGGTDRTDAALEAERFALAVQQGRGVSF